MANMAEDEIETRGFRGARICRSAGGSVGIRPEDVDNGWDWTATIPEKEKCLGPESSPVYGGLKK